MNFTQDAPNAMRNTDSNMATNAKNDFPPCKILLSSNVGGAVPASNDFSSSATCLSETGEMERDLRIERSTFKLQSFSIRRSFLDRSDPNDQTC
jgi:hypothetical protein